MNGHTDHICAERNKKKQMGREQKDGRRDRRKKKGD